MELRNCISTVLDLCLCLAVCTVAKADRNTANVYVDDSGGYNGVLIAVDPNVEYDNTILDNIKGYLRQASNALYDATNYETLSPRYFRDVTILLPNTWPKVPECNKATSENPADANFLVAPDSSQWGSTPHTTRLDNQCGTTDGVTILPVSFIESATEARKYGQDIGKTLVHEWAHQRYGVYDESGPETCIAFEGGYTFPKRCSADINGETRLGQDGKSCSFIPRTNQDAKTSLMYLTYLEKARTFCDRKEASNSMPSHNENITNEHNDRCGGRSVSEVLRAHPDFSGVRITSPNRANNRVPNFQCVQEDSITKMVLTLDISRSMKSQGRLEQMQNDIKSFLQNIPCSNMAVGMVEFSGFQEERTIHSVVPLSNPYNIQSLINALPQDTKERTCIACGVRQAIQTLEMDRYDTNGAVVAIFTDGMENEAELTLADIREEILRSGIVLYASVLQLIDINEDLLNLVSETGGTYCKLYDDQSTTYYDCLENILSHNSPLQASTSVLVHSDKIDVYPGEFTTGSFSIDSQIKSDVVLQLQWIESLRQACSGLSVDLQMPSGRTVENVLAMERAESYVTFDLSSDESGVWTYRVKNAQQCTARLQVEGRLPQRDCSTQRRTEDMISLTPYIKEETNSVIRLHAKLFKGATPVVGASVRAQITTFNGIVEDVELWDNGAGADMKPRDGLYSRYYAKEYSALYADGSRINYNVKFIAKWTPQARLQLSTESVGVGATALPEYARTSAVKFENVERFERASIGHFFQTRNSVDSNLIPPAKITDLRLGGISSRSKAITLAWTAMGESVDSGKALAYDIRVSNNVRQLRNKFTSSNNLVIEQKLVPAQAGKKEEVELILDNIDDIKYDTLYYVGISTRSSKGNAEVSNVVMFIMSSTYNASYQKEEESSFPIWIIGVVLALVILILVVTVIVVVTRKRSHSSDEENCPGDIKKPVSVKENDLKSTIGPSTSSIYQTQTKVCQNKANSTVIEQQNNPDLISQIAHIKAKMRHVDGPDTLRGISGYHTPQMSDSSSDTSSDKTTSSRKRILPYSNIKSTHIPRVKLSNQRKMPRNASNQQRHSPTRLDSLYLFDPNEPLQNHPYSNPLFGDAAIIPEVELRNSAIRQ